MKKTYYFVGLALFVSLMLVSCGPPKSYESAMNFYNTQKYDSALYYFDRLLPEDEEWLDSAKLMKKRCFEKMILEHLWDMYSAQLTVFGKDTALMNASNSLLESELIKISKNDSLTAFYRVYDAYKDKFPSTVMTSVLTKHIDNFLMGYVWNGSGSLSQGKLKFERNEKNECVFKSAANNSFWDGNMTIYKDFKYKSEGVYTMKPRVWDNWNGYSYFTNNGSMRFIGKDTLKVNYGGALEGGEINYFTRGKKLEPASK